MTHALRVRFGAESSPFQVPPHGPPRRRSAGSGAGHTHRPARGSCRRPSTSRSGQASQPGGRPPARNIGSSLARQGSPSSRGRCRCRHRAGRGQGRQTVRFWDASALMPLVVEEAGSPLALSWIGEDANVCVWALTRLELASAVERRAREGRLSAAKRRAALRRVERLTADAHEVVDLPLVRSRALAVLSRHPLRAADAAQLGAALVLADPDPSSLEMVVLDRRLAEAADREGLRVLTWPDE